MDQLVLGDRPELWVGCTTEWPNLRSTEQGVRPNLEGKKKKRKPVGGTRILRAGPDLTEVERVPENRRRERRSLTLAVRLRSGQRLAGRGRMGLGTTLRAYGHDLGAEPGPGRRGRVVTWVILLMET